MSDAKLIERTAEVIERLRKAWIEIENLKRLLEAARHHVEGNAFGMWKFNPEGRPEAVKLHSEILEAVGEYNLRQADLAAGGATTGAAAVAALRGSATIDHPRPDPLDMPGIELHDLFGWAVFTASEGEDERFHAWFAERPTAEAYVKASAQAAAWIEENQASYNAPPPLATAWNASFEPHITRCLAKFAASYADPESIPREHFERALAEHTDDHEKREWIDLLQSAVPWLRNLAVMLRPEPYRLAQLIYEIRMAVNPDDLKQTPLVHHAYYRKGTFLVTNCGFDPETEDGRFTNDRAAVTCPECLRAEEQG